MQEKHDVLYGLEKWKFLLHPDKDTEIWDVPFKKDHYFEENDTSESDEEGEEDPEEKMA